MPRGDGTGPQGQGKRSGKGQCNLQDISSRGQTQIGNRDDKEQQGKGKGGGQGRGNRNTNRR